MPAKTASHTCNLLRYPSLASGKIAFYFFLLQFICKENHRRHFSDMAAWRQFPS
jgi:hypothetical protein